MAQSAFQRATVEPHTEVNDRVKKRARLRRQMYLAQIASFILDAAILFLYSLSGTIPVSASGWYLAVAVGWTLITLILSELHVNDRFRITTSQYRKASEALGFN